MPRLLVKTAAWATFFTLIALYGFSLWALFAQAQTESLWQLNEAWRVIGYSVLQAGLSAVGATLFGTLLARAFFYLDFKGKTRCYQLIAFAWTLPSLVVIFAVIGVWGNAGWMAQLLRFFGIDWQFQLYGLQGILIAHLFLNIPLVAKYYLNSLMLIPSAQHRLAAQLNLRGWHYFRIVELPALKSILPYAFMTVFLVCFTSFPIVLMLGGGPKYSTLEVAIYQAVTFEFDFHKAVWLIVLQVVIGLLLQLLMERAGKRAFHLTQSVAPSITIWKPTPTGLSKRGLQAVIILHFFAIFTPLANVIWTGISVPDFGKRLLNPALWQSAWFSLLLSLIASMSVIGIAYLIALEARQQTFHQQKWRQQILTSAVTFPLILPVFLLAVGLFLLLMDVELTTFELMLLVGVCNGLMLLPYIYRMLFPVMWQTWVSHDKLARSLGLSGWRRWWIVEKKALIRPLANAFALSMASSLGSFSVIAFFGSPDFSTLPYLLYQQLGSYRTEDAAVTALILLLCALLPFLLIEPKESL